MKDLARSAIELRDLVERFAALSEGALRACATADTAVLTATLDARDLLLTRANTLAARVRDRRALLSPRERHSLDELMRPVQRASEHAAVVNQRLRSAAVTGREEVGRQLDQLRVESGATAAYGAAQFPAAAAFDAVR
jgi:tRNA C32,U32 (ribose-2'-O)-methylase TrmJ